jgi:virginiamycin B lyase
MMSFSYRALAAVLWLAASMNVTAGAPDGLARPAPTPSSPALKVATRSMSNLRIAATIPIGKTADWVAVASDGVWIGSTGPFAVSEIDPNTNRITRVELPGEPCAGLAADADNLWVPLCGTKRTKPRLAKVDLKRRSLVRVFDVGPAAPEGGIAVGAGSVWMITDKRGSLARIDPTSGSILQTVHVPLGSYNPHFSEGHIWVTHFERAEVTSVDAATGKVVAHRTTGRHPRFLTAGAGAVWTLNQKSGTISRIDIAGRQPTLTVPLHTPGTGGDITYAEGRIWSTAMPSKIPLSIVDAKKSLVLCQWKGDGGDAIGIGFGAIWLTNYSAGTVSRIALSDLPDECRAANTDQ